MKYGKHKRKIRIIAIFVALLCLLCVFTFVGCDKTSLPSLKGGLYVTYIDVGQGDSILIRFPDGKNMLIDCGNGSDFAVKNVKKNLNRFSVNKLDYLVLTHPDTDHVGGTAQALKKAAVVKAFVPNVVRKEDYEYYEQAYNFLEDKGATFDISEQGKCFYDKDYFVGFLSPLPIGMSGSSYRDFNFSSQPTSSQINDVSPFIYLEYKGIRFLFTGDSGKTQELKLTEDYKKGVFNGYFKNANVNINLSSIDFLKVSHHGSDDGTCQEFLDLINPDNSIISVGSNNFYGHPSSSLLYRLKPENSARQIWRTDYSGTIKVHVFLKCKINITTGN